MGVIINSDNLQRELARRGWGNRELARAAELSDATACAACAGRPVSPTTLRLIASALAKCPPLAGIDGLLL